MRVDETLKPTGFSRGLVHLKNWCEVAEEGGEMSCNDLEIPILTGCLNF